MGDAAPIAEDAVASVATLWNWRRRVADLWHGIRAAESPEAGFELWKSTRAELFARHPQRPLDPGGDMPDYFDYDPALRFAVGLDPPRATEPVYMPAGRDGEVQLEPFAETAGLEERLGAELTLYWVTGYGGGVFLPFLDATSGTETYGGGRYLLDSIKSADHGTTPDGRTILDFNFAYNPSCYYSPRWVCPLAPRGNRLPAPVRGGEKGHRP
ncbi:MAG TPA: DUF1684 domain-containing protein [Devosiaceae bacterium]|nr:DUF1684 domain-containing protein [Devosiaceae bacterium]